MRITKHWNWTCIFANKGEMIDLSEQIDKIENFVVFRTNQWGYHFDFSMDYNLEKTLDNKFIIIHARSIRNNIGLMGTTFFLNRELFNEYFCKHAIALEIFNFYQLFNYYKIPIIPLGFFGLMNPNTIAEHLKSYQPLDLVILPKFHNDKFFNELDETGFSVIKNNYESVLNRNIFTIKLKPRSELLINKL